ncbi:MAG: carboxypeptidase regulatory-like domain-containing protein, partial [Planctomycetes bacterium]|nr:carboxypeptidase regulatory-like domain-containing protein [Planctomycetota bacterium]
MISQRLGLTRCRIVLVGLVGSMVSIIAGCGSPEGNGGTNGNGDANDNGGGFVPAGVARVYGRVLLAADETPLGGVRVTALEADDEAETDSAGRFVIELPAPGTYGVTAAREGYTYAQRRATVKDGDIVAVPDMYLTVVDPATIRIGPEGGTGANSDGSIELEIPPGALSTTTDMHATRYEGGRALPNFLPELSHFTYACDLTPDGLAFNGPVTVRMRNSRGFAPGTPVPIGVYNPATLEWAHESMGTVSDDGEWLVFEAEHFSPRDCNLGRTAPDGSGQPGDAEDTSDEARTTRNNQSCGSVRSGSRVDVGDGHLMVDHVLPSYQTLEQARAIALQYNSRRSDAGVSLEVSYDVSQTRTALPDRIRFVAEIGGNRIERFFEPIDGSMRFAYQWDGRDPLGALLPAGTYDYQLTLANEYRTTFATVSEFGGEAVGNTGVEADEYLSLESTFAGTASFQPLDDAENPLGYGWGIAGLYALTEGAESVTIAEGAGSVFMFAEDDSGGFTPSRGDLSSLTRSLDGSFVWTRLDGTSATFDTQGHQTRLTDCRGNATAFAYDGAGRLASVTDPIGKSTQLVYGGGGRLASITDPAGRVTDFDVDAAG